VNENNIIPATGRAGSEAIRPAKQGHVGGIVRFE
jgi:hypothetical protein